MEERVKRAVLIIFLGLVFSLSGVSYAAEAAGEAVIDKSTNPVEQFTGKYWMETELTSKEAYLFGIESALEIEYQIDKLLNQDKAKTGKKSTYTLSPFEKGWIKALNGVQRRDIVKMVDSWYSAHPDQLDRPVLGVLWYEVIKPRLDKGE